MVKPLVMCIGLALVPTGIAYAQHDHGTNRPAAAVQSPEMADGEVRRVDKDAKKITLRHGEIKSLDMPL